MKKKLATTLLAGVMAASMVMPALASGGGVGGSVPVGDGTEVWAGVIVDDNDAKIKVEVPTLFAFVVKGTVDPSVTGGVTSADGNIYLPNTKVRVDVPSGAGVDAQYTLYTEGALAVDGKLPFTNFSTYDDNGTRKGLAVQINGNIKNEDSAATRRYWTHTASTATTAAATDFKNYNVSIGGNAFDTPANGGLQMASSFTLPAPNDAPSNINTTTKYAIDGAVYNATFDVTVGGERKAYNQVEQSAKVGNIVWTVSTTMTSDTAITAPNEDYLQP